MNIYLIRHAQTTMNAKGKVFSGISDVSLSTNGIECTQKIANSGLWGKIEHIYISPLIRARQTADILFGTNNTYTVVDEFAEMNFGDYEGRKMPAEYESDPIFYKWVNDPENLSFPNGENLKTHAINAYKALKSIAENKEYTNVAIVSHATTIRLILSIILTDSILNFRKIPCDNIGVSLITVDQGCAKVKYINAPIGI